MVKKFDDTCSTFDTVDEWRLYGASYDVYNQTGRQS